MRGPGKTGLQRAAVTGEERTTTGPLPEGSLAWRVGALALVCNGCGIAAGNGRFIDIQCTLPV